MVAFQDLTPTAQTVAEREFMAFYIRHFKRDDLEVLTELASDSQQAMINRVLRTNGFMTVEQLVTVSLPLTKDLFAALLAKAGMEFDELGNAAQPWETWLAERHATLRTF
ncbi:hypothetical protein [Limosilactobacillus ingluviei]|uniref:hypothetical protein n=1 Tax=Limosilactobacillus ingluviei TaxID=148604 RepID=UPI001957FA1F|nr:hypothetical protein [Limosilactobacillus ingluviei]MBM6728830.1 hypothetical protein [Limosilactobacillus ingluviei]